MTERLGIVMHRYRQEVRDLARRAVDWCGRHGLDPVLPADDAELIDRPDLGLADDEFGAGLSVCLSLGGDGTMLRTSSLVSHSDVPILGINGGTLGYLTEFDPAHMVEALDAWRRGGLVHQDRMLIAVSTTTATVADPGAADPATLRASEGEERFLGYALNEAVVSRAESGRSVEVLAWIGGEPFSDYLADGLIVATPTGSTAYSLSAGGPIVEPDFRALLLTPVAAHMVFNRSIVLAPTTEIRLTVLGYRPGVLSLDGRNVHDLAPGQSVICRAADRTARFLVKGDRDFHTVLKEKFQLVDRSCS